MLRRVAELLAVLLAIVVAGGLQPTSGVPRPACHFVLGFQALHDQVPGIVGQCLGDEFFDPTSGEIQQLTTRGLLVWRRSDNYTAFTDGYLTWVVGPSGVRQRRNGERFDWESDASSRVETVFLGDSHFQRWDVDRAFAPQRVANRGISGQTSGEILARFATEVLPAHPRRIVAIAGTNDVLRGVPASKTRANLGELLSQARAHDVAAFVATVPPVRTGSQIGRERSREANHLIAELDTWIAGTAPDLGATVIDFHALLADDQGELSPAYAEPDGIHLNGAAYDRLADLVQRSFSRGYRAR